MIDVNVSKTVSHFIDGTTKQVKQYHYLVFDVESSLKDDSDGNQLHKFELCVSQLVDIDTSGKTTYHDYKNWFRVIDFQNYIEAITRKHPFLIIIGHNVGYD